MASRLTAGTDFLTDLRLAVVLLSADRHELYRRLCEGIDDSDERLDNTDKLVVAAAKSIGIVISNESGKNEWIDHIKSIAEDAALWAKQVAVLRHHSAYLSIASRLAKASLGPPPSSQIEQDPNEYREFLLGVSASHRTRATQFAGHSKLTGCRTLVDVGGGTGTFSAAWIDSRPDRSAVLIDLPAVNQWVSQADGNRMTFLGRNLEDHCDMPAGADLYLVANVLHLLPNWREVLAAVIRAAKTTSVILVMEADAAKALGGYFGLQVHLRSGGRAQLIPIDVIHSELLARGLLVEVERPESVGDPFHREYAWLFALRRVG